MSHDTTTSLLAAPYPNQVSLRRAIKVHGPTPGMQRHPPILAPLPSTSPSQMGAERCLLGPDARLVCSTSSVPAHRDCSTAGRLHHRLRHVPGACS